MEGPPAELRKRKAPRVRIFCREIPLAKGRARNVRTEAMTTNAYTNFDVWGVSLLGHVHAFKQYPTVLEKLLERTGITTKLDPETLATYWIPMPAWIQLTHGVAAEVGASTAYSIGRKIAEAAPLPPEIDSITAVLMGVDVSYHMHHRKDGVVMFDPATGSLLEGIGHYRCELQEGNTAATMTCDNPYSCDLDRGILAGFAGRFEPAVSVTHSGDGCRKKGDEACIYFVQW
jgi:hypothetical protein